MSLPKICLSQNNHPNCNRIMVDSKGETIYLPAYLTLNIRNFKELKFQQLIAQICASLQVVIYVKDLPSIIVDQLDNLVINLPLHGNISLSANKNSTDDIWMRDIGEQFLLQQYERKVHYIPSMSFIPHHLKQQTSLQLSQQKNDQKNKISKQKLIFKQFKITTNFKTFVEPEMFLTPFELVDLILTISIKTINLKCSFQQSQQKQLSVDGQNKKKKQKKKQKNTQIKFMIMNTNSLQQKYIQKKINFNSNAVFGQYDLAQKKLHVQISTSAQQKSLQQLGRSIFSNNTPKPNLKPEKKFEQYIHFHLPLYKFPFVPLLTIIIPLIVLGIINISIFYQAPSLGDRIGNISALMIAFIGIVPVIRESIPRTPIITGIQILVYLQTFTTIFCLIESWINRHEDQTVNVSNSFLFKISLLITILVTIIPIILLLIHQFYLKDSYNQKVGIMKQDYTQYLNDWNRNDLKDTFFFQKIRKQQILIQIKKNQRSSQLYNLPQYKKQQQYLARASNIIEKIAQGLYNQEKKKRKKQSTTHSLID